MELCRTVVRTISLPRSGNPVLLLQALALVLGITALLGGLIFALFFLMSSYGHDSGGYGYGYGKKKKRKKKSSACPTSNDGMRNGSSASCVRPATALVMSVTLVFI